MQKTMAAYKDVHRGKSAVLFLTGPSLNDYVAPEENLIKAGVNTAIFHKELNLDYHFIQDQGSLEHSNSYVSRKEEYDSFSPNIAKFYGITLSAPLRESWSDAGAVPYEFSYANIVTVYLQTS